MASITDAVRVEEFDVEKYSGRTFKDDQPIPQAMELHVTRPLSVRVKEISRDAKLSDYSVDSCITVTGAARVFREFQVNAWNNIKNLADSAWKKYTFFSLASLVGAAAFGIASATHTLNPRSYVIAAIFAVSAIVIGIFAVSANNTSKKAAEQITLWNKSPENDVAAHRAEAYRRGFPYALSIKGKEILHANEAHFLYDRYFPRFCSNLTETTPHDTVGKDAWVKQFLTDNPLQPALKEYGLSHDLPTHEIDKLSKEYVEFAASIHALREANTDAKSRFTTSIQKQIDKENEIRNLKLQPYAERRDHEIGIGKANLNKVSIDSPAYPEALKTFNAVKSFANTVYDDDTKHIREASDKAIKKLNKERDAEIARIDSKQSERFADRYLAARQLLEREFQAWRDYKNPPVEEHHHHHHNAYEMGYLARSGA